MKNKKLTRKDLVCALRDSECALVWVGDGTEERLLRALNEIINPERTAYYQSVEGVGACGEKVSVAAIRVTNHMLDELGDKGVTDSIAKKYGIDQVTGVSRMMGSTP